MANDKPKSISQTMRFASATGQESTAWALVYTDSANSKRQSRPLGLTITAAGRVKASMCMTVEGSVEDAAYQEDAQLRDMQDEFDGHAARMTADREIGRWLTSDTKHWCRGSRTSMPSLAP